MAADGGIKFGSYVLLRRIARGGMAEVFLAQQRGLEGFDRRVAVKRILPHLADSGDFVRMFLGEAKLAAQLSHPNIVHIYEFGKVDHDYFIAMEYVDGVHAGQLFKAGENRHPLSPTLIARVGADAAAALHHAHELRGAAGKPLGLVHRDVSPANIMISYDGVVKLCDFGIAKAATATEHLTSPGQVKGKYAYMSPEQTIAQPLDGRSDVFSLAICLWELLAGRVMVPRGDPVAAMRMLRDGKLEPLGAVAPHLPPALVQAIGWALEPKREKRATAAELAQALEAFIKSSPEIATSMQLGTWVRAHFVRVVTGEAPAVVPAAGQSTQVAPGTLASPRTQASRALASITPEMGSHLAGASRRAPSPTDTLELTRPPTTPRTFPSAPTVIARPAPRSAAARDETATAEISADRDASDVQETVDLHRASRPTTAPPLISDPAPPTRPRPRARGIRIASTVAALAGLMGVSFAIAVCASRPTRDAPIASAGTDAEDTLAPTDPPPTGPPPTDPPSADPPSADPPPALAPPALAPPALAPPALAPVDASAELHGRVAYLEIVTMPGGGKLKVGDQVRVAPAQIVVDAGTFDVTGELPGFQPEVRRVAIEAGEHLKIELTFHHKLGAPARPAPPALGRLTVRTTPYSEVFENGKKLDQTPFADREMTAGAHTLVFKNPLHPDVTRKITIAAGKALKLNFALPE